MTGPLAPLFAQLEGTLNYFEAITLSLGRGERTERLAESRTALSSIERHVQDMSELLRRALAAYDDVDEGTKIDARMGYPLPGDSATYAALALHADLVYAEIRAALPAREKEEEWGCAACDGDPEAHGLHVCGRDF